jgi:para-nitrobenzyl esterase
MADYWVRFAATGDPNGGDAPVWPAYDAGSRRHIIFGDEISSGEGVRDVQCQIFDSLQEMRLGIGS